MMRLSLLHVVPALLAASLLVAAAAPVRAGDTVLVLDGSGSMWGNLGQEKGSKIDFARAAIRKAFQSVNPASRLALMSFGHRRKADCNDVQVIAPLEAGPLDRILGPVDTLDPKGKGPLALTLKEAAKPFAPDRPGTVIIVHDGPDNCWQDQCAAAADLAKANPKLVVHTIGLSLERPDVPRMACVAKAFNGRMYDVQDVAGLDAALAETMKLAGLDSGAEMAAAPPKDEEPQLRLKAALSSAGPSLSEPVRWRVVKADAPGDGAIERVGAEFVQAVAPGTYRVEVHYGLAHGDAAIEVKDKGASTALVSLEAGTLKIAAKATKAGDAPANPLVSIEALGDAGPAAPLWIGRDALADLVLPKGRYRITAEDGLARQSTEVVLAAGARADADLVLGTGRLELSAQTPEGEALKSVVFELSVDDPDAPGGRREIARSADPLASFTLVAGTYYAVARLGAAEVRDRIAVGAGSAVKHPMTLAAARLFVDVKVDAEGRAGTEAVAVRVLKADAQKTEVARSVSAQPQFVLPPQRYVIEAALLSDAIDARSEIDVPPGRETRVALKLESGVVTIAPAGARAASARWIVKDTKGRIVLASGAGGSRSGRLAPGKYVVQTDGEEPRMEQAFELKAGERRTVDLPLP